MSFEQNMKKMTNRQHKRILVLNKAIENSKSTGIPFIWDHRRNAISMAVCHCY